MPQYVGPHMATTSLDHTVAKLDEIVDESCAAASYLAVFPAMYRSVTSAVRDAVRSGGFFDDDARLEELTVVFADLYLDAYDRHRSKGEPPACWTLAFEIAEATRRHMILQHVLLGMNAHINLDLGVAAAQVSGGRLPPLYADFVRVNEILFQILDGLQGGLGAVSPRMSLLDRLGGSWDETFMRIGIRMGRDLAWSLANRLCEVPDASAEVTERDGDATWLGRAIVRGWSPMHLVGRFIASAESTSIDEIVAALTVDRVDLDQASRAAADDVNRAPNEEHRLRVVAKRRRRSVRRAVPETP